MGAARQLSRGRQNGRQRGKLVILVLFLEEKTCDVIIFKFQGGGIGPNFPPAGAHVDLLVVVYLLTEKHARVLKRSPIQVLTGPDVA